MAIATPAGRTVMAVGSDANATHLAPNKRNHPMRLSHLLHGACLGIACVALPAVASSITVIVPGPLDANGMVGCGLFASERGFPMDNSAARMQWQPAQAGGVRCVFQDVADGSYAVSVLLDMNRNQRVDTNFVGLPTEAWGVSNNARPSLRAPRFDEAMFKVTAGQPLEITVRVAK